MKICKYSLVFTLRSPTEIPIAKRQKVDLTPPHLAPSGILNSKNADDESPKTVSGTTSSHTMEKKKTAVPNLVASKIERVNRRASPQIGRENLRDQDLLKLRTMSFDIHG